MSFGDPPRFVWNNNVSYDSDVNYVFNSNTFFDTNKIKKLEDRIVILERAIDRLKQEKELRKEFPEIQQAFDAYQFLIHLHADKDLKENVFEK